MENSELDTVELKPQDQVTKQGFDWGKQWRWQKGQSGNPGGRKKGSKTMKTWAREYLESMSEEARIEFVKFLSPDLVWRMAEGNPEQKQDTTISGNIDLVTILKANDKSRINRVDEEVPAIADTVHTENLESDTAKAEE